jgi:HlyD family secretion protein
MEPVPAAPTLRTPALPLSTLVSEEQVRQRRQRWVWWILAAAVPVAAWGAWQFFLRPVPVPIEARFRIERVSSGDVLREIRATGRVEAVTTVRVGSEISGRIASVLVDYNAHVKAGQILARFDRATLDAQLQQVDAVLQASRASLAQAKTDRDRTGRDLDRLDQLFRAGFVSAFERDAAADAARFAVQRLDAAEAQLAAQQAAYAVARTNLSHAIITAPIDGIVITRNVDPGQTVASVLQSPDLFVVAADLRRMRVIAGVDEADMGELKVGQRARFTVNAYANRWFEGVVTEIRNSPAIVQDVVTYGTVVEVGNPDLALKPGMTAATRIQTALATGVLRVPAAALTFTPPGEQVAGSPGIWLLEQGKVRRVPVTPGVSDGELTQIAPGALTVGTQVLVDLTLEGRRAYGLVR